MRISGWIGGGLAAGLVGASFPVSEALVDYPYEAGQAIRYLIGALILTVLLKGRLGRPTLKEFALLSGVAAVGMVIFNLAVLGPVERAITIETGSPDRVANMRAFTVAALDLLEQSLGSS